LGIPAERTDHLRELSLRLAAWTHSQKGSAALVVGLNGAQGSGKSTLAELLVLALSQQHGLRATRLSIDDFYMTRAERTKLAESVHPLLVTRGVPGTHDVALALTTIRSLLGASCGEITMIPSFDKASDDRRPRSEWTPFEGPVDILIFEGWCVGAEPQNEVALASALNALEAAEDPDGRWRRYVNDQLMQVYPPLFRLLDRLIMLRVPNLGCVLRWRGLQERKLAASLGANSAHHVMGRRALRRFVMHYERLTRAMLAELPARADLTLFLDTRHRFTHIQGLH
jgi:D-glycerate 3-kinase